MGEEGRGREEGRHVYNSVSAPIALGVQEGARRRITIFIYDYDDNETIAASKF